MPPNLLDLPNEVLNRIAYYVHDDNDIPLPSTTPHFDNFISEVDMKNNKDYMSFRAVCEKTSQLFKIKGLHIYVRDYGDVLSCLKNPIRHGVRRLIIFVHHSHIPIDMNAEIQAVQDIWKTVIEFFSSLTSLKELIIRDLPLCYHHEDTEWHNIKHLQLPSEDFLPKVKSISFQTPYLCCARHLPRLFIPAAPNLQHLKMIWSNGPSTNMTKIFKKWSERHLNQPLKLISLNIKSAMRENQIKILKEIATVCPTIEKIFACGDSSTFDSFIQPQLTLGLPFISSSEPHQEPYDRIELVKDVRLNYAYLEHAVFSFGEGVPPKPLFDILAKFTKLTEFDCMLEIDLLNEEEEVVPRSWRKKSQYVKVNGGYTIDNEIARANRLLQAMVEVADLFIDRIPSLQKGYFWTSYYIQRLRTASWCRWSWTKQKDNNNQYHIILNPVADQYPQDFLKSKDGFEHQDYESGDETKE